MTGEQATAYRWRRRGTRETLVRFAVYLGAVAVLVWAVLDLDIFWPWVVDAPIQMADLLGRMVPPDVSTLDLIGAAMLQTIHIATLATLLALILAMPVAYLAAQNTTPNSFTLALGRLVVVSTRSVNTIIWALLFVAIFGPGPLAGILAVAFRSIGFLGKLVAESIEETDRKPVEAMEATGASKAKVIAYAIVPQVMPTFFAVAILRWDINIRESTVLGLVGAGGIGLLLQGAIDTFKWQEVATILIAILLVVVAGEFVSGWLRRKVI
ncbi:MAG: phosphonate ABC transporter, permease protein PhnE [Trueperaceae bacterium]|nr:phosphonate ABC transporter, permease protein PhnE [Trueperaceae bacterium]